MKKDSIFKNEINTEADSNVKGIGLQKLRAAERLLRALLDKRKCVFCATEYIDDVIEVELSKEHSEIQTEQNKNYTKSFSMNSEEVKNSLRIFFDTWRKVEDSESIVFVFYTNTGIAKENRVGTLKDIKEDLPDEPLIQLLIDGKYDVALPFIIPIVKEYYIEQHKKHTEDNTYYENLIEDMKYEEWKKFFCLVEWKFDKANETELRNNLIGLIKQLCIEYGVENKHCIKILASILDMIESRVFESDFLNKVVHVSEIKLLFYDFIREAKVAEKLDPLHIKWDEIKCDDVRDLEEKILNVCPEINDDILQDFDDDFIEGKFEQQHCVEIREVKAYNYRVYKACKKYIRNLLKDREYMENIEFSEEDILKIIDDLSNEAEATVLDKSKTYKIPYLDKDMVHKTVLILFQECYLSLDKVGDIK